MYLFVYLQECYCVYLHSCQRTLGRGSRSCLTLDTVILLKTEKCKTWGKSRLTTSESLCLSFWKESQSAPQLRTVRDTSHLFSCFPCQYLLSVCFMSRLLSMYLPIQKEKALRYASVKHSFPGSVNPSKEVW